VSFRCVLLNAISDNSAYPNFLFVQFHSEFVSPTRDLFFQSLCGYGFAKSHSSP